MTPAAALAPISVSAARAALAVAQRNFDHAADAFARARTARRLAEAALAEAAAAALAGAR